MPFLVYSVYFKLSFDIFVNRFFILHFPYNDNKRTKLYISEWLDKSEDKWKEKATLRLDEDGKALLVKSQTAGLQLMIFLTISQTHN